MNHDPYRWQLESKALPFQFDFIRLEKIERSDALADTPISQKCVCGAGAGSDLDS